MRNFWNGVKFFASLIDLNTVIKFLFWLIAITFFIVNAPVFIALFLIGASAVGSKLFGKK